MPKDSRRPTQNLRQDNKSGMWNVYWKVDGRVRTESLGTRNLKEARELAKPVLARVEAERAGVVAPEPRRSALTWETVCETYRGDTDAWPTNAKTRARYEIDLARIGRFLAEEQVGPAEVGLRTVKDFVAFCRNDEELTTASAKHALTVFSCAMGAAAFDDLIEKNPVKEFDRKRLKGKGAEMNPPLNGEFERMRPDVERLAGREMALFTEFLHRTGCRCGEALHARAEDVFGKPGRRRIYLHEGVKRERPRSILL